MLRSFRPMCLVLGGVDLVSAALLVNRVQAPSVFLDEPGARLMIAECIGLLGVYATVATALSQLRESAAQARMRRATYAGAGAAAWMCAHILTERYVKVPLGFNGPVVVAAMLVLFAVWGWVGFSSRRSGERLLPALGLAAWSATVTMTLGVCFGFLLELYLAPVPATSVRSWPEFQRSGWSDPWAFAIANTMDSAISHMIAGPVVALLFGGLGILLASASGRRLPPRPVPR